MNTQALTVNFHGTDLFIVEYDGQPYTPMKQIVEGMGLDWSSQLAKLNANPTRWGMVKIAIPTLGDMQEAVCMPLRKIFGWLSGIYPNKVKPELRDTIVYYQNECDDVLWEHWTKGQSPYIPSLPLKKTKVAVEGGLSLETQDELKNMINGLAATLPKDKQASAVIGMWSALGTHFEAKALKGNSKLAAYKFIPEASRLECVSLLARLPFNDMVTLSNTDMMALIDSKVQEQIKSLPAPELSLDTKISQLIDVKIKTMQGELMPKANVLSEDQMIVSRSVLQKALRRVCGSTFTIHRHDEITVKISEAAYQQSESAFFSALTA